MLRPEIACQRKVADGRGPMGCEPMKSKAFALHLAVQPASATMTPRIVPGKLLVGRWRMSDMWTYGVLLEKVLIPANTAALALAMASASGGGHRETS